MDKQSGKVAVDVDLESRGRLKEFAVVAIAITAVFYYYASSAKDGDESGEELWLLWTIVWLATRLFQLVAFLAFLLLLVLVFTQRRILYVPVPPGAQREPSQQMHPDRYNIPYLDVTIKTEDNVKINGWLLYQESPVEVPFTVLYFHGNAGNIGHRMENLKHMYERLKYNILIIDYRGYGCSEDGDGPCQDGFLKDAKASYRWIVHRIQHPEADEKVSMSLDRILFFGRSIGGAVALKLGAELLRERLNDEKLKKSPLQPLPVGFILENTFTNLREMAIQVFGFLRFLRPLLRYPLVLDEWKGDEALKFIGDNCEHWCLCLLSGRSDQLVPPQQMDALHDIARARSPQVLRFEMFPDGGHNDTPTRGGEPYWCAMRSFMEAVKQSEKDRT